MKIESNRFGCLEVGDEEVIEVKDGLIGFPTARTFVLLRKKEPSRVGWLQSTTEANLAFPVVSVESLTAEIPLDELTEAVTRANLDATIEECAIMAVICAAGNGVEATVNLMAPIVVNAQTRKGAQVILENSKFSTREKIGLVLPPRRARSTQSRVEQPAAVANP